MRHAGGDSDGVGAGMEQECEFDSSHTEHGKVTQCDTDVMRQSCVPVHKA